MYDTWTVSKSHYVEPFMVYRIETDMGDNILARVYFPHPDEIESDDMVAALGQIALEGAIEEVRDGWRGRQVDNS